MTENKYTFNFSYEKFAKIVNNKDSLRWYNAMYDILPQYNINTVNRVAGFLAQTTHESNDYRVLSENLNYSAKGLLVTFPKRFAALSFAKLYERKPEKIANYIYSNRYGNGPESSGDGWKYRGRGIIQLTFKNNYKKISEILFNDNTLVETPDIITTDLSVCINCACIYWKLTELNKYCDNFDIKGMTRVINGGFNGLDSRKKLFDNALRILGS